jgi:flagellar hook assembly protein FlgD
MIYDILGHEVRTLVNNQQSAGFNSVVWNGKDKFGKTVGAGMYLYKISAGKFRQTKKMILLK